MYNLTCNWRYNTCLMYIQGMGGLPGMKGEKGVPGPVGPRVSTY